MPDSLDIAGISVPPGTRRRHHIELVSIVSALRDHVDGRVPDVLVMLGRHGFERLARRHAEQLRRELMTLRLVELTDDQVITASFGIAAYGRFTPLRVALQTADMALYLAKNSGRNRVCVDGDPSASRDAARQAGRNGNRARAAA